MGLFDGPSERLRIGFQSEGVEGEEALIITRDCLLDAAKALGLGASARRTSDGDFAVQVRSIDRAGGTVLENGTLLWFFLGPRRRIAALADKFLERTLDRPEVTCVVLPETY